MPSSDTIVDETTVEAVMALVVDQLQLWTIGFRWAGFDPARIWLRIPTAVRDNFSTLLEAILSEHLDCLTLASERYQGDDPGVARYHIRYWLDDVYAGIQGSRYRRELLRHAVIERSAFKAWCERRSIPLPEFWFPPGWTEFRWPEFDSDGTVPVSDVAGSDLVGPQVGTDRDEGDAPRGELRGNQIARIASQQIARVIWKAEPATTIAAMCRDERVLKYGGANFYGEETVRRWLQAVAPAEVSAKRGRPKTKNTTDSE